MTPHGRSSIRQYATLVLLLAGAAACSGDSPAGPSGPMRFVITPDTAVVLTRDSVRFTVTERGPDGRERAVPAGQVTWTVHETERVRAGGGAGWFVARREGMARISVQYDGQTQSAHMRILTSAPDSAPPVLSVVPIDVMQVTSFPVFADTLWTQTGEAKLNPTWEMRVPGQFDVRAAMSGEVLDVSQGWQGDWNITTATGYGALYHVIYDHLLDVSLKPGDRVTAGQVIGRTNYRVELQVNRNAAPVVSICPALFGTTAFNAQIDLARQRANPARASTCLRQMIDAY